MNKDLFMDAPDILNAKQVSELLTMSLSGAYKLMNRKDFPVIEDLGRKLVMKSDLISWLESHARKMPESD